MNLQLILVGVIFTILSSIAGAMKNVFRMIPYGPIVSSVLVITSCIIASTTITIGVKDTKNVGFDGKEK
jgi:hypothetical protein